MSRMCTLVTSAHTHTHPHKVFTQPDSFVLITNIHHFCSINCSIDRLWTNMPLCYRSRDGSSPELLFFLFGFSPYLGHLLLSFCISRSIRQGKHVPWKEARVQKEDPREEVFPQPGLQRALCLWSALRRGPERHQRGAATDGLRRGQLTLSQHRPRSPGAGHVCSGHPRRALEGDLRPPASPNCQVARLVRGLEHRLRRPYLVWCHHKRDGMRMGGTDVSLASTHWTFEGREGNMGSLEWCHYSINHSNTNLWSYRGSPGRARGMR